MTTNGQIIEKEIFSEREERRADVYSGGVSFFHWATAAGEVISAWWSPDRDIQLRSFTKNSDHISGTVNTLRDMMVAIPVHVRAYDTSVKSHVRQANQLTETLNNKTESRGNTASTGWGFGFGAFVEDYLNQDNGSFMAIEGAGQGDKPIVGSPIKLIHLDSGRCQRTGHIEYPVLYDDPITKRRHKLHKTRIIAMASSSPITDMHGVGFCAVSRCINNGQVLIDISRYKQEKLGSRPRRGLIVAEGATPNEVKAIGSALESFNEMMDNRGLSRYTLVPVVGAKGPLSLLDLASLPDGFDELQSTQLSMAAIALAFGVDMRQLAFAFGVAGQTKADAEIQHLKMRGKGPGAMLREVERQFNAKVLPPHLYLEFDYQDDEQDTAQAEMNKLRAEGRKVYIDAGVISDRIARQQMVETGELDEAQFIDLELENGRLEDGSPIEALFYINDRDIQAALNGIDPDEPDMELVDERLKLAYGVALNAPTASLKEKGKMVARLLEKLKSDTEEAEEDMEQLEEARMVIEQPIQGEQLALPEPEEEDELKQRDGDEVAAYEEALTKLIEKAQAESISKASFEAQVKELIWATLPILFYAASDSSESEMDEAGMAMLQAEIDEALEAIPELATNVYDGDFLSMDEGGKGNSISARAGLWADHAAGVYNLGQTFKANDPYLRWDRGSTKQPCPDCIRLGGQVHKASKWREKGFWPQGHSLECKGFNCRCSFSEVKGPESGTF